MINPYEPWDESEDCATFDDILSMPDPFPIMERENRRHEASQAHLRAIDWAIGKIEGEK